MSLPPPIPDLPRQPLECATPAPRRPGILTAVGIISIIIAGMSLLASLGGVAMGITYFTMSKMAIPAMAAPASATPVPAAPATPFGPVYSTSTTTSYTYTTSSGGTVTTTSSTTPGLTPFRFNIPPGASILSVAEAVLSLCVAVLLMMAGISMLRDSPKARRHLIYVALKLPLILLSAVATWWTFVGLMGSINTMPASNPGAPPFQGFTQMIAVIQAVFWAGFSMVYPIALLIVLSTRTAKDYFAYLQSSTLR